MTRKRARESESRSASEQAGVVSAEQFGGRDEGAGLRTRNAALETANTELRCLADYRSQSLARLAHELRNPLTSILGFAEILLSHEELTTAQVDFCRKIQNSALQIEACLSQLSDLSRLEAGSTALSLEEFSLAVVLNDSCRGLERETRKHNVQLRCHADGDAPEIVSDCSKIRQVLYNFLAHAISRSPDGATVNVTLGRTGPDFRLKIEDDGEHLTESSQKLLGADPMRSDQDAVVPTEQPGLAIAQRLIAVLGATLQIQNREPRGIIVMIQFPARPPDFGDQT